MEWFHAPDYWLSRWLFERALAAIYLIAFLVAADQFPALLGERGLLSAPRFLAPVSFREAPSLFHLGYSDRLLLGAAGVGAVLSAALLLGLPQAGPGWVSLAAWLALWVLYLSIVNVGQVFYGFGWESLLLEAGFIAAFLGPAGDPPPLVAIVALRWLLFRVEFGAGLIKLRGDRCWRDLTCLYYHHETQPMPNPLSWYFHRLPRWAHRAEVAGNHVAQLVVPFGLFAPQPVASIAGALIVVHQGWLILSGNFAWLNWVTLALAFAAFDDSALGLVLPVARPVLAAPPVWQTGLAAAFGVLMLVLSYWPARNLCSRRQLMNFSFNRFHLCNTYGAFGSITRERYEVVLEGSDDGATWHEYELVGKPGDPRHRPPQIAPYHLRLDWLMWLAAMRPPGSQPWLLALVERLLEADKTTLRLLRFDPFGGRAPAYVRASYYRYRFTTRREHRETGAWWVRTRLGDYLPACRLTSVAPFAVLDDRRAQPPRIIRTRNRN